MDTAIFTAFDGAEIAYHTWEPRVAAEGLPPVVLQHGFAASTESNWVGPGVVDALLESGRRVIGVDARGHGRSQLSEDPAFFGERNMSRDHRALFDLLELPQVDLVGYSMGAVVSLLTASRDGRVRRLVVGGVGGAVVELGGVDTGALDGGGALVSALRTDEPANLTGPAAEFRRFAEVTGADLPSLAAQAEAVHDEPIELEAINAPTVLIAGTEDHLARDPERLVAALPHATLSTLAGDHLGVVGNGAFASTIVGFLDVG
ncbi:Lysophospholipase, alpha-beta hydrolase superfamily [Actinopolyspora mzabensis]|uniref:Lysophospholipase, alpha-beta hydrolase superfamily n=1 Tax=Actinopolyspora mzabensis TaxID=995066 RepID=A0A1G8Y0J6_ACTMZ|nr:alpha/beta hydrolase [Actinopolyspora mzabensis]SDJ96313.1 Lysophospholipase, alpha-beta hydrolase superfamily [Actinopolyspora mzabensis]